MASALTCPCAKPELAAVHTSGFFKPVLYFVLFAGFALASLSMMLRKDKTLGSAAMALTILAYSFFTGCCYFATAPWQLGAFRFMAALGMGSLLGVGQGSVRESQLVVAKWYGAADKSAQPIAFVIALAIVVFAHIVYGEMLPRQPLRFLLGR